MVRLREAQAPKEGCGESQTSAARPAAAHSSSSSSFSPFLVPGGLTSPLHARPTHRRSVFRPSQPWSTAACTRSSSSPVAHQSRWHVGRARFASSSSPTEHPHSAPQLAHPKPPIVAAAERRPSPCSWTASATSPRLLPVKASKPVAFRQPHRARPVGYVDAACTSPRRRSSAELLERDPAAASQRQRDT